MLDSMGIPRTPKGWDVADTSVGEEDEGGGTIRELLVQDTRGNVGKHSERQAKDILDELKSVVMEMIQ